MKKEPMNLLNQQELGIELPYDTIAGYAIKQDIKLTPRQAIKLEHKAEELSQRNRFEVYRTIDRGRGVENAYSLEVLGDVFELCVQGGRYEKNNI